MCKLRHDRTFRRGQVPRRPSHQPFWSVAEAVLRAPGKAVPEIAASKPAR
ncbi:MAG: hypothetical protein R3D45_13430 [Rhizobiaceae bacterium]